MPLSAAYRLSVPTALRTFRPGPRAVRLSALALLTFLSAGLPGLALANDRLFTLYDWRSGLDAGTVTGVAQDADGFILIATSSGLLRFDGRRFVRVTDRSSSLIQDHSRAGPVYLVDDGVVKVLRAGALEPVLDPSGAAIPASGSWFTTTENGSLWVVTRDGAACYRTDGTRSVRSDVRLGSLFEPVGTGRGDEIYAWSRGIVAGVGPKGDPRPVARSGRPSRALESIAQGSLIALMPGGEIRRVDARGERVIASGLGRPLAILERGEAVWAGFDTGTYRIGGDDIVERIGEIGEVPGGDWLFLDRENNLWMSSAWSGSGLYLFPEPETALVRFTRSAFPRSVVVVDGEPWFGAWWGLFRIVRTKRGWEPEPPRVPGWGLPLVDGRGRLWEGFDGRFGTVNAGAHARLSRLPGMGASSRAAPSASGGVWIPTDSALFYLARDSDRPELILSDFPDDDPSPAEGPWSIYESHSGELLLSTGSRLCRTDARAVERRDSPRWRCEMLQGVDWINQVAELPGLGLLAATNRLGVLRRRGDDSWVPLPPTDALRTNLPAYSLKAGGDDSLWMVLEQDTARIRARPDRPEGYEVVEQLSVRQGMPHLKAVDVCEDGAGGLWVALPNSAAHVPASARGREIAAWPAQLVEATVDGKPLSTEAAIELPHSLNRLELRFAALTFTDPTAVRYRMRLHEDDAWSDPVTQPEFRFVDLPSGGYNIAVQAAADGTHWEEGESRLSFRVLRPWYMQAWFLLLAAATLASLAWGWHRTRLAAGLRLERQRARIAMDLHDEIGAGLGGIGLMAGLAARPDTASDRRVELSGRVAAIASSLASSLQDIVWSLRPGATQLESLAAHIVDRGHDLFADGTPEFTSEIPERLPAVTLSLPIRRDVLLIAQEAMHNARRHSGARRVIVRLEPQGRKWRLTVTDDGTGIPEPAATPTPPPDRRRGLGLASMRSRAGRLGADLEWRPLPAGGTEVRLVFDPGAETASHDRATRRDAGDAPQSGA